MISRHPHLAGALDGSSGSPYFVMHRASPAALARRFVEAHRRRRRHVERLLAARLRDAHAQRAAPRCGDALPFVAEDPRERRGSAVSCSHCASRKWCRRGAGPARRRRRRPRPRPAPARSARPCRRAAPWATTAPRALERDDLREAQGRRRCAGCCRRCPDPAAGRGRRSARWRSTATARRVDQEADRRRRLQAAQLAHQRVGETGDLGRAARERLERRRGPAGLGDDRAAPARPRCSQRAAQMVAFEPDAPQLAIGRRVVSSLRRSLNRSLWREVTWRTMVIALRTGAAQRRCAPARRCAGAAGRRRARERRQVPRCL